MPIFDLKCRRCGFVRRDVLLSVKVTDPEMECPQCRRRTKAAKLPCRVHARFYGDGFYKANRRD